MNQDTSAVSGREQAESSGVPAGPDVAVKGNRVLRRVLLLVLLIAGLGSLAIGVKEALAGSIDFQWSGAQLLSERTDPYKTFIGGDPGHRLILGQQPNYLQELYVILLPLGRMDFSHALRWWCGLNLFFLGTSIWLVARFYRLSHYNTLLLGGLLLASTPLRVALANGQQTLFALWCFAIAFTVAAEAGRGVALGVGFAKYSFAPVIAVIELVRLRWVVLVCAGVPIVAGLLIMAKMTGSPLKLLLVEPLGVAKIAMSPGYGDVMTMLQMLSPHFSYTLDAGFRLGSVVGLLSAVASGIYLARRQFATGIEIAVMFLFTLFCFKHIIYDFVFLVFPVAALLELSQEGGDTVRRQLGESSWPRYSAWAALIYLMFFGTVESRFLSQVNSLSIVLLNGIALLVGIVAFIRLGSGGGTLASKG